MESGRLKVQIQGQGLKDLDFFSKSDPICLVEELVGDTWTVRGQTERIENCLDPHFVKAVEFDFTSP